MLVFLRRLTLAMVCASSLTMLAHAASPATTATPTPAARLSTPTVGKTATKPPPANDSRALVDRGIEAYMKDGPDAALAAWLQYSALEGNSEASGQANSLRKVGEFYGKVEGADIIHEHAMSPRTRMIVAVIHYEKGPLFLRMQTYQTKAGHWVATEFNFNTNAIDLMPDTLTFGRNPNVK